MKGKNAEQTAAQVVGTRSEMNMALGVRKGVGYISQRLGTVTVLQPEGVLLLFTQMPRLYWGTKMYPTACRWAHLHTLGGHTAHLAECKANSEDLTMEVCCWMLMIARYHKLKRYWLALIHGHKTAIRVWS